MTEVEIEGLAQRLAKLLDPDAPLTSDEAAALLGCSARYLKEGYCKRKGFPQPAYLPGPDGRRGEPRWIKRHLTDYVASLVPKTPGKPGRPRGSGATL